MPPTRREPTRNHEKACTLHSRSLRSDINDGLRDLVVPNGPTLNSSMVLNIQTSLRNIGLEALKKLVTNVLLPAAELSFTKEQKAVVEFEFKIQELAYRVHQLHNKAHKCVGTQEEVNVSTTKESQAVSTSERQTQVEDRVETETDEDDEVYNGGSEDSEESVESEGSDDDEPVLNPQEQRQFTAQIASATHQKRINSSLKSLHRAVYEDRRDECGDQADALYTLLKEMEIWCRDLFEVAFVKRVRFQDIHMRLTFMLETMQEMRNSGSSQLEDMDFTVSVNYGKEMGYPSAHLVKILVLFWRDLMLISIKNKSFCAEDILSDLSGTSLLSKIQKRLRPVNDRADRCSTGTNPGSGKWGDEWHSDRMKAALPKLWELFDQCKSSMTAWGFTDCASRLVNTIVTLIAR